MEDYQRIIINKKSGVVCWKLDCKGAYPNTEVVLEKGLTVLAKINGESKLLAKEKAFLNSLVNPGKGAKLIGGKKPYESCEMFVFDQTTEFSSEWGLAGENALACKDYDFGEEIGEGKRAGIDCSAVATGSFYYKIENFFSFSNAMTFNSLGEISRDDVREELRAEICAVAKAYLAKELITKGVAGCQEKLPQLAEEIKREISQIFAQKGIVVDNLIIDQIEYSREHLAVRKELSDRYVDERIIGVGNKLAKDRIDLEAKRVSEVITTMMDAQSRQFAAEQGVLSEKSIVKDTKQIEEKKKYCTKCGEKLDLDVNFCPKCGEKLK